jgi:hypothetical protein
MHTQKEGGGDIFKPDQGSVRGLGGFRFAQGLRIGEQLERATAVQIVYGRAALLKILELNYSMQSIAKRMPRSSKLALPALGERAVARFAMLEEIT